MLRCKEVAKLVSQSMDQKLPFWQRMGVWMHLKMCRFCSGFRRQLLLLREAARRNAQEIAGDENPSAAMLSGEARERISRVLEDQKP